MEARLNFPLKSVFTKKGEKHHGNVRLFRRHWGQAVQQGGKRGRRNREIVKYAF